MLFLLYKFTPWPWLFHLFYKQQTIRDFWVELTLTWLMFSVRPVIFSSVSLIHFPTSLPFLSSRSCNTHEGSQNLYCGTGYSITYTVKGHRMQNIRLPCDKKKFPSVFGTLSWWTYIVVFSMLTYLLIFPFFLQQHHLMFLAFTNATLMAHRYSVLFTVINQRPFMALTQRYGFCSFNFPKWLSTSGAVCSLSQARHGDITVQYGSGVKLGHANGTLMFIIFDRGVPVHTDAELTESVTTGDGYRDFETFQTDGTDQVWILRIHF